MQEKQIKINGLSVNYKIIGDGNMPIILLHGWGVNSDKYIETANELFAENSECRIFVPDLPGFGKSDKPEDAWGVDGYAEFVKIFIRSFDAGGVPWIIIGHSFGGQIAIKFAEKYPDKLKVLILTGAAGVRHSSSTKQKIFIILAKAGKIIFSLPLINKLEKQAQKILYKAAKEKDYYEAQGVMKEVFKKVINEDVTNCLGKITSATLFIWGANDRSTPLADGQLMAMKIESLGKRTEFKIVSEANHSLPYQYPEKFAKIIADFIEANK